jgi:hypothetical protein
LPLVQRRHARAANGELVTGVGFVDAMKVVGWGWFHTPESGGEHDQLQSWRRACLFGEAGGEG